MVTDNADLVLETIKSRCVPVPLIQKYEQLNTTLEKIEKELFSINENKVNSDIVCQIINFIEYVDKNKLKTILHLKKLLKDIKYEKEEITILFNIILLFYKDVLEYKTLTQLSIFNDYLSNITNVSQNNSIDQLIRKIKLIIEILDDLKYNVNIQMEFDKFILKMEEI